VTQRLDPPSHLTRACLGLQLAQPLERRLEPSDRLLRALVRPPQSRNETGTVVTASSQPARPRARPVLRRHYAQLPLCSKPPTRRMREQLRRRRASVGPNPGLRTSPRAGSAYVFVRFSCGGPRYGNSASRSLWGPTPSSVTFRFVKMAALESPTSSVSRRPLSG